MLSVDRRLTKTYDFDLVREEGKYFNGRLVGLGARDRGDKKPARFGFVVSNKVSKFSSIRNKVKRALREAVRQQTNFFKEGYDIVIIAYPETAKAYTDEIMRDTVVTIKKAGVLK